MKDMKAYLAGALLAAAVATVAGAPGAQAFPEREIEVIVNYGAGGGTDLSTRVLADAAAKILRSEEHTSELQSLMRISYAVFCLKKKKTPNNKEKVTKLH